MRLHLFAHNNENFVSVGDKVKKYETKIASIGTGNGSYYAHLHHSISEGLSVEELRNYVSGWTKEEVQKHYIDPRTVCDYSKMFKEPVDVGNRGYGWLSDFGNGYHPGQDINGLGGGNTDVGYEFTSSCDGVVIYVNNTDKKDGWGKMVIVEESQEEYQTGIDVSHWQGDIDWTKVQADFAICKCTQGVSYVDPTYKKNKKGIIDNGIRFGAYHFADGLDPIDEARHFLDNLGELKETDIIVLDWEIEHTDPIGWCNEFLEYVEEKIGFKPWWYTNDARGLKYGSEIPFPKWIARYADYSGNFYSEYEPKTPNWEIWQYTSRGSMTGISGNVDKNVAKFIINESNMEKKHEENFRKIADAVSQKTGIGYGDNPNDRETENMLDALSKIEASDCSSQEKEIASLTKKLSTKEQEVTDMKEALEKSSFAYKLLKDIQRVFMSIINFK